MSDFDGPERLENKEKGKMLRFQGYHRHSANRQCHFMGCWTQERKNKEIAIVGLSSARSGFKIGDKRSARGAAARKPLRGGGETQRGPGGARCTSGEGIPKRKTFFGLKGAVVQPGKSGSKEVKAKDGKMANQSDEGDKEISSRPQGKAREQKRGQKRWEEAERKFIF